MSTDEWARRTAELAVQDVNLLPIPLWTVGTMIRFLPDELQAPMVDAIAAWRRPDELADRRLWEAGGRSSDRMLVGNLLIAGRLAMDYACADLLAAAGGDADRQQVDDVVTEAFRMTLQETVLPPGAHFVAELFPARQYWGDAPQRRTGAATLARARCGQFSADVLLAQDRAQHAPIACWAHLTADHEHGPELDPLVLVGTALSMQATAEGGDQFPGLQVADLPKRLGRYTADPGLMLTAMQVGAAGGWATYCAMLDAGTDAETAFLSTLCVQYLQQRRLRTFGGPAYDGPDGHPVQVELSDWERLPDVIQAVIRRTAQEWEAAS